jgi:hypothetical protein
MVSPELERNKFAKKAVGIGGRSRATSQHASPGQLSEQKGPSQLAPLARRDGLGNSELTIVDTLAGYNGAARWISE